MRDDGSGDFQVQSAAGPFNVAVGGTYSGWIEVEHSGAGYHHGPAHMTFCRDKQPADRINKQTKQREAGQRMTTAALLFGVP